MPEEVLFEIERKHNRAEIAAMLRDVANKLDAGAPITFSAGSQSVTLEPPEMPTFEVKVERETSSGASAGELSIEFELEWNENAAGGDGGPLSIE